MLVVMFAAARWRIRRIAVPLEAMPWVGLVALGLLLIAESA
jgi:hypothetical protein